VSTPPSITGLGFWQALHALVGPPSVPGTLLSPTPVSVMPLSVTPPSLPPPPRSLTSGDASFPPECSPGVWVVPPQPLRSPRAVINVARTVSTQRYLRMCGSSVQSNARTTRNPLTPAIPPGHVVPRMTRVSWDPTRSKFPLDRRTRTRADLEFTSAASHASGRSASSVTATSRRTALFERRPPAASIPRARSLTFETGTAMYSTGPPERGSIARATHSASAGHWGVPPSTGAATAAGTTVALVPPPEDGCRGAQVVRNPDEREATRVLLRTRTIDDSPPVRRVPPQRHASSRG
jgi:hypothetical protein